MFLDLQIITGFKNVAPEIPVIIRDYRGVMFYDTTGLKKLVKCFNLPAGKYIVESGKFAPLKNPVPVKLTKLPAPERNYPKPFNFKILFGVNPNKCSIIWRKKTILFDNSLFNSPLPELYFILFHEYGHQLYHTEKFADLFSTNYMKKRGYNDSQIGLAQINSLSTSQIKRKKFIIKNIINRQKK